MQTFTNTARAGLVTVLVLALTLLTALSVADSAAAAPGRVCGTDGASGLAVSADRTTSCATALQVAGAYTQKARGATGSKVTVQVGGTAWNCQERQGSPNPYQQCVSTADSGRWVTLTS
ncbi:hypothetical protein ACLGIH_02275 [Streptomyces sp. HMX87]|uniref:hypothetical protein n=1 Tax=Streptomyces sp. HMX87 TaxID=3390849 RepID=UPI003A8C3A28